MPPRQDTITSASNPWVKSLRRAASRGTPVQGGLAIAESPHLLQEAIRSGTQIDRVFATERMYERVAAALPPHRRVPTHRVSDRIFGRVSTTARSQGVLALVRLPAWEPSKVFRGLTIALDGVQNPGNAGTIVRSAEAFGATGVVFLAGSASPTNPKALRAAAGSLFRMPFLARVPSDQFLELAKDHGKEVYFAEARGGVPARDAGLSDGAAVVIGSETHGVGPGLAAAGTGVGIPTQAVESLSAPVAASILLYEYARRPAGQ